MVAQMAQNSKTTGTNNKIYICLCMCKFVAQYMSFFAFKLCGVSHDAYSKVNFFLKENFNPRDVDPDLGFG